MMLEIQNSTDEMFFQHLQKSFLVLSITIIIVTFIHYLLKFYFNLSLKNKTSVKITVDDHSSSSRRSSTAIHVNRLPYKLQYSFGPFNLPKSLEQRRLFRRPEVTRYLGNRRQSRRSSILDEHDEVSFSRRGSTAVRNLSLQTPTNRRFSIVAGRTRRPSTVGNLSSLSNTSNVGNNSSQTTLNYSGISKMQPAIRQSDQKFVSTQLSSIAEVEEPPEEVKPKTPDGVIPRRMSRKLSIRPLQRRASRRVSVLKNSIIDIPGIPAKLDRTGSKPRRKSRAFHLHGSASIPRRIEKGFTGDLAEFKSVFSPTAHEVLLQRYKEFGPIYQFSALGQNMVFLFDYEDLECLKKAEGRCPRHIDFKHLRVYRERNGYPLGVLVSNGEEWKQQRKILSKLMMGSVNIMNYIPAISEVAKDAVSAITTLHYNAYKPELFTGNYAMEAFGRVLYGQNMGCLSTTTTNNMHKFVEISRSNFEDAKKLLIVPAWLMPLHPAWTRHNERWNFLLDVTMANIEMYGNRGLKYKNKCLLSELLGTGALDKGHLFINFTDLLVASIDTTSNVLQWCLYELGTNLEIQRKVYNEIRDIIGRYEHVTQDVLQQVVLLKSVIKETLRLHPVGFFTSRITEKDMYVRNCKVPAKTHVAVSMYVMGRNEKLFPNPNEFHPERWLSNRPELERFYNDVPFGFGPRMCLGRRIAELKILLFLLHFCLQFEFEATSHNIKPLIRMLMVPSKQVTLKLTPRE